MAAVEHEEHRTDELRGATQVTIGGRSMCGARADGSVACAGRSDPSVADLVAHARDAAHVAHNGSITCVLARDGRVGCIGDDRSGGVGDPHGSRRYAPRPIEGLDDVVQVSAAGNGGRTTCARRRDGSVACWGGQPGLLGVTDGRPRATPTPLAIPPAIDLSVGLTMACAVHREGALTCWADDHEGVKAPARVPGVERARDVAASQDACVVVEGGRVLCIGSPEGARTPQPIPGLPPMESVETFARDRFAGRARDGTAWVWWTNLNGGVVGRGERVYVAPGAASSMETVYVDESSVARAETRFGEGRRVLGRDVAAVAAGQAHGCVLLGDGSVDCFAEMHGKIGAPSDRLSLRRVPLHEQTTAITCGDFHTCALLASGQVACWGERGEGQLGDGTVGRHRERFWITVPAP